MSKIKSQIWSALTQTNIPIRQIVSRNEPVPLNCEFLGGGVVCRNKTWAASKPRRPTGPVDVAAKTAAPWQWALKYPEQPRSPEPGGIKKNSGENKLFNDENKGRRGWYEINMIHDILICICW